MSPLPNPMLLSTCPSLAPAPLLPPRHPASHIPPTSFEIQLSFLLPHCPQKGCVAFGTPVSCGLDLELPPTIYPSPEEARQWSHRWCCSLAKWCLGPVFLQRRSEQYMRGRIQQPLATWAMSAHVTFIK